MEVLKVLWRPPTGDRERRESALPTDLALGYRKDQRTTPSVGKLMVYLPSKMYAARVMCWTASEKYWRGQISPNGLKGEMEIWRVGCHNLYLIKRIVWPGDLEKWPTVDLARFWRMALKADFNPRDARKLWPTLGGSINPCDGIWTTDWVIPRELLATYDIRLGEWDDGWKP